MRKPKKLRALIKRAKTGNLYAMYQLGICYQLGRRLPQDMNEATAWIVRSAEGGYAPAIQWMEDYFFDDNVDVQSIS